MSLERRTRMRQVSKKKAKANRSKEPVREAVFERDGGCILRGWEWAGPCFGERTPHHLLKDGQGGSYSYWNLVECCSSHNAGWIESHPEEAHNLGLVIWAGDLLSDAWAKMRAAGLTTCNPDLDESLS